MPQVQSTRNKHTPFLCGNQKTQTINTIQKILYQEISTRSNTSENETINKHILQYINIHNINSITEIIKGVVYKRLVSIVKEFVDTNKINICIQNIYQTITEYCLQIWKNRCDTFILWEKIRNISNKRKKHTKYNKHVKTPDPVKDCYPKIVNKFMENYIK
jgi:hypothetical protein